ncbi:hypothetical protein CN604_24870 [Bacillus wiedmannii]|uniref:hypothetical protein n=1 Tax=Bacillus wiedmannii TaxID=1890302 RepID=UPI000BF23DCB|nr:hypothetical protein [Bacillus wiedmannii]PEL95811.1 hypothetical protein CN604_24870 [Bacillus wiedmannii]
MADVTKIESKYGNIYGVDGKKYRELSKEPAVGDTVLIIDKDRGSIGYEEGETYEVVDTYSDGCIDILDDDHDTSYVLELEFVIVEPIEQANEPEESEFVKLSRRLTRLEERTEENHRNILTFSQMTESARSDASKAIGGVNALDEQLDLVREDIVYLDEKVSALEETRSPQNITININVLDIESARAIVESITKGRE